MTRTPLARWSGDNAAASRSVARWFVGRGGRVTLRDAAVGAALLLAGLLSVANVFQHATFIGVDAYTYLAAGERLNAGHALYALGPGDRPVVLMPPYWTVPLLYPPLIAVLWRPLALLPGGSALIIWWAATIVGLAWALSLVVRRTGLVAAAMVALLSSAIAAEVLAGNVDAWILIATILAWRLGNRGRWMAAGALIGVSIVTKLTPLVFAWWLVVERRREGLVGALGATVVAGIVSIAGAGIQAHLEYVRIAGSTAGAGATPLSLAGVAGTIGIPQSAAALVPYALLIACAATMVFLRDRPGMVFALAVLGSVLGSPVVSNTSYTRLLAALAPLAFPAAARTIPHTPARAARNPAT